ncbi:hypothetical protein ROR02_23760 [Pararhodospirillum oryzae]|uniref:Uncharacterized protein n=1 Tax=Pararhodospirillum oryzae TaxID=478448 RepID=A0A512H9X1_9PROT|nr:hypothetical protein ROR02_23760 [Pararhodospirillum oryzae]
MVPPQPYTGNTAVRVETVAVSESTPATQASGGSTAGQQDPLESYHINPKTILDPDLYVNVAKFVYDDNVEFQVPSPTQIAAYRRGQDAQDEQVDQQQVKYVERVVEVQETTDGDGVGGGEAQGTGVVTAAVVSQGLPPAATGTPPQDDATSKPATGTRAPTAPRHVVEVEA